MENKTIITSLLFLFMAAGYIMSEEDRGIGILVEKLTGDPVIGKQYLLIIGINDYQHWVPLRYPERDAKEIRDIITSRYYIDEVIELYNGEATKAAILKTLEDLQQKLKAEDSLLIFYAGHGHLDTKTDSGFWIPVDAGIDVYAQKNWLHNISLRGSISRVESRHILIISDSCFSGDIIDAKRSNQQLIIDIEYFKKAYARISRQVLTSGALETVPDKSEFSYQLKMALKSNRSKYLDPLMLFADIRLGVTKTTPLFGVLSDTGHQAEASFLLFLRPGAEKAEELCSLFVSTETPGILYLDGKEYGEIQAGTKEIKKVEPGTHILRIEYTSDEEEVREVTLTAGENLDLAFTWKPETEPEDDLPDTEIDPGTELLEIPQEPEVTPKTRPFMVCFSGAFSTAIGETFTTVSPLGGCELTGEWKAFTLKPVLFSIILDQWYIYHPGDSEAEYLNNLHILYSGLGCGMDVSSGSSFPFTIGFNLLGGVAIGIVDNDMYTKTVFLVNPGIAAQVGITYNLTRTLALRVKAQYLAVIGLGSFMDWYHEVSIGAGIGVRI